jgi:Ca-activated chloride channel family protein
MACFVAALSLLVLALARPSAVIESLAIQGNVVLAIDVSASMRANDVEPSRLELAKRLAKHFVAEHSDVLRIAVVSFAGTATAEADFATGREELFSAIDRLGYQPGTSVGYGIIEALTLIFPRLNSQSLARAISDERPEPDKGADPASTHPASRRTPGSYASAAIVLFSDGQSPVGPAPADAARLAADHGVRIHTIGIGTGEGSVLREAGRAMRVQLDEVPLRHIAESTRASYVHGGSVDWSTIVASIRRDPSNEVTSTEVTAIVAGFAALTALLGAMVSLRSTLRIL